VSAREDRERGREAPPQRMAETNPPTVPMVDYSFTLQAIMEMQKSVGKLTEAVESLKEQTRGHGHKLDQIGKDVHAAKVVIGVVGSLILVAAGFLGWIINTLFQYLSTHPVK
jgi:hypothetical protein